ncbi:MAG: hypothetical protein ACTSVI_05045 [Promethearchaeota archaeon]
MSEHLIGIQDKKVSNEESRQENGSKMFSRSFFSFPISRLLAAILLLVSSWMQAQKWGVVLFSEHIGANWLFLGGPSLWFPTGLFPLIYGAFILVYLPFHPKKVTISLNDRKISIKDKRYWHVKEKKLEFAEIKNVVVKPLSRSSWLFWTFPLGLQAYFLLQDGLAYLLNPFAFGVGIEAGWSYLFQAAILLASLIILLMASHLKLIIHAENVVVKLKAWIWTKNARRVMQALKNLPHHLQQERDHELGKQELDNTRKTWRSWVDRLILGIVFLITSIISMISRCCFAGEALRATLFCSGLILIIKVIRDHDDHDTWDFAIFSSVVIILTLQIIHVIWLVPLTFTEQNLIFVTLDFIMTGVFIFILVLVYFKQIRQIIQFFCYKFQVHYSKDEKR